MSLKALQSPWPLVPLRHVTRLNPETLGENTDPDVEFSYIDIGCIKEGQVGDTQTLRFENAPSRARRVVREGDVIISTVRTYLRAVAGIGVAYDGQVASTGFAVLRPEPAAVVPGFVRYWCLSEPFVSEVVGRSAGVSYPAINASEVVRLPIPLPPLAEQRRIADYLDRETRRVDGIVAKNEGMIALLEERHDAASAHEFLSLSGHDTPETLLTARGTGLPRVKHLIESSFAGNTPTAEDPAWLTGGDTNGIPWLGIGNLKHGKDTTTADRFLDEPDLSRLRLKAHEPGTILFAMYGATAGKVSRLATRATWNQAVLGLVPDTTVADPDYLYRWLQAAGPAARSLARSNTQDNFNAEQVLNFPVPLPNLTEQRRLASRLNIRSRKQSRVSARLSRQNRLLRERRQTLITAAVTGQLNIEEAA